MNDIPRFRRYRLPIALSQCDQPEALEDLHPHEAETDQPGHSQTDPPDVDGGPVERLRREEKAHEEEHALSRHRSSGAMAMAERGVMGSRLTTLTHTGDVAYE
jgi:hypothetical protein